LLRLRSLGAIETGVAKKVPLIHILIFKYGVDWKELVNAPQGNKEDIEKAQKLLDEVRLPCPPSSLPTSLASIKFESLRFTPPPHIISSMPSSLLYSTFFVCR
jgi:hypothetical protein